MARQRKPPKHGQSELVVQKLSTGELVRPKFIESDFNGELIPVPEYYGPFKPPVDAYAKHIAHKNTQAKQAQAQLLQAVGIIPGHGYHLNKPQAPKLAFNQVLTESGLVITPKVKRNPLRRM